MAKQLKSRRLMAKTKRNQNPTDITKKRSERKTSDSSNMTGGSDEARRTRRRSSFSRGLNGFGRVRFKILLSFSF